MHRVPQSLRNRVIATLKLKYASRRLVDEVAMMRDVNPTLRTDIQMHVLAQLVAAVPIFQACRWLIRQSSSNFRSCPCLASRALYQLPSPQAVRHASDRVKAGPAGLSPRRRGLSRGRHCQRNVFHRLGHRHHRLPWRARVHPHYWRLFWRICPARGWHRCEHPQCTL